MYHIFSGCLTDKSSNYQGKHRVQEICCMKSANFFEVVPTETMRNSMLQLNGCNLKVHRKWWPHVILTWKMSVGTPVCTVIWWIYYASMIKHSVLDHIIVMQKPLPISIAAELSASINTGLAILNSLAHCCPLTGSCQQQPSPWSLCSFTPAWCIFHDLQIKWIDNCLHSDYVGKEWQWYGCTQKNIFLWTLQFYLGLDGWAMMGLQD